MPSLLSGSQSNSAFAAQVILQLLLGLAAEVAPFATGIADPLPMFAWRPLGMRQLVRVPSGG